MDLAPSDLQTPTRTPKRVLVARWLLCLSLSTLTMHHYSSTPYQYPSPLPAPMPHIQTVPVYSYRPYPYNHPGWVPSASPPSSAYQTPGSYDVYPSSSAPAPMPSSPPAPWPVFREMQNYSAYKDSGFLRSSLTSLVVVPPTMSSHQLETKIKAPIALR